MVQLGDLYSICSEKESKFLWSLHSGKEQCHIPPPSFIRCSTITAHLGKDEQLPGTILTEIKAVASQ